MEQIQISAHSVLLSFNVVVSNEFLYNKFDIFQNFQMSYQARSHSGNWSNYSYFYNRKNILVDLFCGLLQVYHQDGFQQHNHTPYFPPY